MPERRPRSASRTKTAATRATRAEEGRPRNPRTAAGYGRRDHVAPTRSAGPVPAGGARSTPVLVAAACVALLLGLPVAFRGLYFPPQQLLALVAACLTAALVWWVRGPGVRVFWRDRLDIAALSVVGAYLLSLTVAVHPNAAVQSWLLRLLYFLAFWCAAEVSLLSPAARRVVLFGLLLGGALAALSGVAAAGGAFASRGFFLGGRIYSSIQYPDAAAAFLAAMAFVALGMEVAEERMLPRVLYAVAAATYLFAFVFALSRGAELVFAPVAVLFVAAQWRGRWADGTAALVGALLGVGAGALPYLRGVAAVAAHRHGGAAEVWLGLVAAWVVAALAVLAWDAWRRSRGAVRLGAAGVAALAAAAALAVVGRHLSRSLLARLGHVSLQDYNAWSRLQWARDALKLVARHPILGMGGGGWAAAYRSVQSYYYTSTQVHDGWIQTWVSTGTVGLICWVALWVLLAVVVWRAWRQAAPSIRPVVVGLAAGCAMLGAHATIDFTLSLGGVSVGLWGMAGLLRSLALPAVEPERSPAGGAARGAAAGGGRARAVWSAPLPSRGWQAARAPQFDLNGPALAFYGALGLLAVFALVLWTGGRRLDQGNAAAQAGQLTQAAAVLNAAVADDPWSSTAYFGLAEIEENLAASQSSGSQTQFQDLSQAQADYQRSLALNPYGNLNAGQERVFYAQFLQREGQMQAAVVQLRQALADGPYVASYYDSLDLGLVDEALADVSQKHVAAGRQALAAIDQLAAQRAAVATRVPPQAKAAEAAGRVTAFGSSDVAMRLSAGEAAGMAGRWSRAEVLLKPLASQGASVGGEANLWLGLIEARLHRPSASALASARSDLGSNYSGQDKLVASMLGTLTAKAAAKK